MDSWKTLADTQWSQWVCCICRLHVPTFFHKNKSKKKKKKKNNNNNNRNSRNNNKPQPTNQQPTINKPQPTTNNQQPTNKGPLCDNIFSHHHYQLRDPSCQDDLQKPKVVMPRRACGRVVLHKVRPDLPPKGNVPGKGHGALIISMKSRLVK